MSAHQAQMGKMILCVLGAKSGTCFIRGRWDLTDSECLDPRLRPHNLITTVNIYVLFMRLSPSCDLCIAMAPKWFSCYNILVGNSSRRLDERIRNSERAAAYR